MLALLTENDIVVNTTDFKAGKIPPGFENKGWKEYSGTVLVGDIDNGDGTYSRPPPRELSDEELANDGLAWMFAELSNATEQIFRKEDGMTIVGNIVDWRNYRVELRGWPQDPDFPDESSRPVGPS